MHSARRVLTGLVGLLQLWKLHFLREDAKAEDEANGEKLRAALNSSLHARDDGMGAGSQNASRPASLSSRTHGDIDSDFRSDPHQVDRTHSSEHTQPVRVTPSVKHSNDFHMIVRHARQRSGHSVHSVVSNAGPSPARISRAGSRDPSASSTPRSQAGKERGDHAKDLQQQQEEQAMPAKTWKDSMPSKIWSLGALVFLVGNVLDFIALGLTKVSIVTLVGSGSLVVNTVMARLLLKETVTFLDVGSAVLIIIGISLTVIGNQSKVKEWTLKELIPQYRRPDVVAMLVALAAIISVCVFAIITDKARRRALGAQLEGGIVPKPGRIIGAVTCIVGAFIATFTILFGKAFSGLILLSFGGDNQFTDVFTVIIVLVFLVSLPSQLVLINMSLAINDALMHIPNFCKLSLYQLVGTE